ncbi:FG-GAP-like repeat-containing protein, partial [Devosia sp.]|uniref:FG-GAP-like repeat-containing protein n=1 Tax=Devosia sp. TaxID=1871048 RepID=UPI002FC5CD26
ASAANHVVTAQSNFTFSPSNLTIDAGDTVTFQNGGGFHNVVSDPGSVTMFRCANGCDGAGGNGNLSGAAWSATVTFPTPGAIGYHCEAHGSPGSGMAGTITVEGVAIQPRPSDFNGDGKSDVFWRNTSTGGNTIWLSANRDTQQSVATVSSQSWKVVGIGDFNEDGKSDVLWRNFSTGGNTIWKSANRDTQQAVVSVTSQSWKVVQAGDFNGDGKSDVLWRDFYTGSNMIWKSGNQATQQTVVSVTNLAWIVAP